MASFSGSWEVIRVRIAGIAGELIILVANIAKSLKKVILGYGILYYKCGEMEL
jgi:hypothetical protein